MKKINFTSKRKGLGLTPNGYCQSCGATVTLRGEPLTGFYCSPTCKDKAIHRGSHEYAHIGRDLRLSDERD